MTYSGLKAWTFINSAVYCMSIVTTIGAVFVCQILQGQKHLKLKNNKLVLSPSTPIGLFISLRFLLFRDTITQKKIPAFFWQFTSAFRTISHLFSILWISLLGYGHISPATDIGRAITIVYAIIGIPIFLTLLADFGKLFTRNIKFLWAYVRRLYYTGSLRRVRKQAQVQVNSFDFFFVRLKN